MGEIAYQNKDIASKMTGEALVGGSLAPFGRPDLKIVSMLPTNLPAIESNELRLDHLFVLDDGSLAVIDYESVFSRENFIKYINYIARIIKRYARLHRMKDLTQIRMVVIYTADVEKADSIYDLGGLALRLESAFLVHLDTEEIYRKLEHKILRSGILNEEELTTLMVLPLTVKGKKAKQDLIVKAVKLAKQITERSQSMRALAGILTFSDKVINDEYRRKVKEEMQMTQIEQMIFEDGVEAGIGKGIERGIERGEKSKACKAARNMFDRGFSAEETAGIVEEEGAVVQLWYREWRASR